MLCKTCQSIFSGKKDIEKNKIWHQCPWYNHHGSLKQLRGAQQVGCCLCAQLLGKFQRDNGVSVARVTTAQSLEAETDVFCVQYQLVPIPPTILLRFRLARDPGPPDASPDGMLAGAWSWRCFRIAPYEGILAFPALLGLLN